MLNKRIKISLFSSYTAKTGTVKDVEIVLPFRRERHLDEEPDVVEFRYLDYSPERIPLGTLVLVAFDDDELRPEISDPDEVQYFTVAQSEVTARPNLTDPAHKNAKVYVHTLSLVDPIFLWDRVSLENLTFTDLTTVTVYENSTPIEKSREPFYLNDVVNRILSLSGDYPHGKSWLTMTDVVYTSEQLSQIREKIGRLAVSFDEDTLYDAMFRLANYIDCVPKLEFTPTAAKPFRLRFVSLKGLTREPKIAWESLLEANSGWWESENKSQLIQGYVSNISGVATRETQVYPSQSSLGASIAELDDGGLQLPANISEVTLISVTLIGERDPGSVLTAGAAFQVSLPCFTDEIYATLDKKVGAHYTRGSNVVALTRADLENYLNNTKISYYKSVPDAKAEDEGKAFYIKSKNTIEDTDRRLVLAKNVKIFIKVYYKAYLNIRLRHMRSDTLLDSFFNQLSYKQNVASFSASFDSYRKTQLNPDLVLTKIFDYMADIPPVGQLVTRDGHDYVIAAEAMEVMREGIKTTFTLAREMVKRSAIVTYNNAARMVIPTEATSLDRFINILDRVDLTLSQATVANTTKTFIRDSKFFLDIARDGLAVTNVELSANGYTAKMPAVYNVVGTSLTFTVSFMTNLNAMTPEDSENFRKLTDSFGAIDKMDITLKVSNDNATTYYRECVGTRIPATVKDIDFRFGNAAWEYSGINTSMVFVMLDFYNSETFNDGVDEVRVDDSTWKKETQNDHNTKESRKALFNKFDTIYTLGNYTDNEVAAISIPQLPIQKDTAERPVITYQLDINCTGGYNKILDYILWNKNAFVEKLVLISLTNNQISQLETALTGNSIPKSYSSQATDITWSKSNNCNIQIVPADSSWPSRDRVFLCGVPVGASDHYVVLLATDEGAMLYNGNPFILNIKQHELKNL